MVRRICKGTNKTTMEDKTTTETRTRTRTAQHNKIQEELQSVISGCAPSPPSPLPPQDVSKDDPEVLKLKSHLEVSYLQTFLSC
jgi:hypothetical protein